MALFVPFSLFYLKIFHIFKVEEPQGYLCELLKFFTSEFLQ
jgi:hypothetical protein